MRWPNTVCRPKTTLAWGRDHQAVVDLTQSLSAIPVFIVGAGRELLGTILEGQAGLHVGAHGDALAAMTQIIQDNWASLAHEGFPEQYWFKRVGDEFNADRTADGANRRWVEVVDTGVLPLEILDRLFPRALVVNVVGGFLQGGRRSNRRPGSLSAGRYLEVRIADVKGSPELIERQVLEFLGEKAPGLADEVA